MRRGNVFIAAVLTAVVALGNAVAAWAVDCSGGPSPVSSFPDPGECYDSVSAPHRDRAVILNDFTDDAKDGVAWRWPKGGEIPVADLGSPTTTTDYVLCIFDMFDNSLLGSLDLPAGPDWSSAHNGFKYKARTPNERVKLLIRGGTYKRSALKFRYRGAGFGLPAVIDTAGELLDRVQFELRADNGKCWATDRIGLDKGKTKPTKQKLFFSKTPAVLP